MPASLYIYYKVDPNQRAEVEHEVRALLHWSAAQGVTSQLMRRVDSEGADCETWMEIYSDVPHNFEVELARRVAATRLGALAGTRRTESFAPLQFSY